MITLFSCHNICALNNTCVYAHTWLCQHIEALKLCSRLHIAQLMRSHLALSSPSSHCAIDALKLCSRLQSRNALDKRCDARIERRVSFFPPHTAGNSTFAYFHPTLQATQHLLISTPHRRQLNICLFPPHTAGNSYCSLNMKSIIKKGQALIPFYHRLFA